MNKFIYKINYSKLYQVGASLSQSVEDPYYINGPVAIEYMELNNGKKILFLSDFHLMHKSACSNLTDQSHLDINNSIDLDNFIDLIINALEIDKNCIDFFIEASHVFDKKGGAHLKINKKEIGQKIIDNLRENYRSDGKYLRVHNFDLSMFQYDESSSIFITVLLDVADKVVVPVSENLVDYFTKLFHELITVQDEYPIINELVLHNEKHREQLNEEIEKLNQDKIKYKAKFDNGDYSQETYDLILKGVKSFIEDAEDQKIAPFGIKTSLANILNIGDHNSNEEFLTEYNKYLKFIATKINKQLDNLPEGIKEKIIQFYTEKLIKKNSKIDPSVTNPIDYLANLRLIIVDLYTTTRLLRKFDESKEKTQCSDDNSMNNIIMFGGKAHIDNYIEFINQLNTEGLLKINFNYKTIFIEKNELDEDDNPSEYTYVSDGRHIILNQCQKVDNNVFKPFGINIKSLISLANLSQ